MVRAVVLSQHRPAARRAACSAAGRCCRRTAAWAAATAAANAAMPSPTANPATYVYAPGISAVFVAQHHRIGSHTTVRSPFMWQRPQLSVTVTTTLPTVCPCRWLRACSEIHNAIDQLQDGMAQLELLWRQREPDQDDGHHGQDGRSHTLRQRQTHIAAGSRLPERWPGKYRFHLCGGGGLLLLLTRGHCCWCDWRVHRTTTGRLAERV